MNRKYMSGAEKRKLANKKKYEQNEVMRIIKEGLKTLFPNIEILLRIFLSFFITNVPDERSFSKLKFIKNALRNSLSDEKLNSLALMSIENEILDSLNLDEIIDEFVLLKERRKIM